MLLWVSMASHAEIATVIMRHGQRPIAEVVPGQYLYLCRYGRGRAGKLLLCRLPCAQSTV